MSNDPWEGRRRGRNREEDEEDTGSTTAASCASGLSVPAGEASTRRGVDQIHPCIAIEESRFEGGAGEAAAGKPLNGRLGPGGMLRPDTAIDRARPMGTREMHADGPG